MPPKDQCYNGTWTNTVIGVPEGDGSKLVKAEIKVSTTLSLILAQDLYQVGIRVLTSSRWSVMVVLLCEAQKH